MRDPISEQFLQFELEVLGKHQDVCAVAGYANVSIIIWHRGSDAGSVELLDQIMERRLQRFPKGVSAFHLVTESAGLPSGEARNALAESARRWESSTASLAVVIGHRGFAGSALRSAVTGIQMLSRINFPMRISPSLQDAAKWMSGPHREATGVTLQPASLVSAVEAAQRIEL